MDAIFQLQIGEKYPHSIDVSTMWPDDTISSVVWTVPTGITKSEESNTTTIATVWLERTAGGMLTVTCKLTSAAGCVETIEWLFIE